MRHFLVVTSLLAFSALASAADADSASATATQPSTAASSATAQAAAAPAPRIVCHRETPTGSTIAHTVCEREDAGRDQQLATDLANAAARNRPITSGARGG